MYVDNELTSKWLNRLRVTANSNASKDQHAQLSSILDFFNRENKGVDALAPIDWDSYENSIHTSGVVAGIRAKYDQFMEAEFDVQSAVD